MGIYYHPPQPHIGGRQPLEKAKLLPDVLKYGNDPPFVGSCRDIDYLHNVLLHWRPEPEKTHINLGERQFLANKKLHPDILRYGSDPPFAGSGRDIDYLHNILQAWIPPPPVPWFKKVSQNISPNPDTEKYGSDPPWMGSARDVDYLNNILIHWIPAPEKTHIPLGTQQFFTPKKLHPYFLQYGNDPPWASSARDIDNLYNILEAWIPTSSIPQILKSIAFIEQLPPTIIPSLIGTSRDVNILNNILLAWIPLPPQLPKRMDLNPDVVKYENDPPFINFGRTGQVQSLILSRWLPDQPFPLKGFVTSSIPGWSVDNPPFTHFGRTTQGLSIILSKWIPDPPVPPKGFITMSIPGWVIDNPPPDLRRWMANVRDSWKPGIPTTMKYTFRVIGSVGTLAVGELTITFGSKEPTITFSYKKPYIIFDNKNPEIEFSG